MPSPFPGIDPFIESQKWPDFHNRLIIEMADLLMPNLRPRYVVEVERNVSIEEPGGNGASRTIRPDLTVSQRLGTQAAAGGLATEELTVPLLADLPEVEEKGQTYLAIRETASLRVVTVIELLSPENKRPGARARDSYEGKRRALRSAAINLVEMDLLRGGESLNLIEPSPPGDYFVNVYRPGRKQAQIYAWPLPHRLPRISVPLAEGDDDVALDLQAAATAVYDRAGYDYSLRYDQPLNPPLTDAATRWCQDILKQRGDDPSKPTA